MRGKCKEQIIPENRGFEEQKSIEQEDQNLPITVKMVNLYHASLCLARGQLKLSAVSCCPDEPPSYMQFIHMKEHVAINNQYKINTTNLVQYKYSSTVNVYNQMRILVMLCSESF